MDSETLVLLGPKLIGVLVCAPKLVSQLIFARKLDARSYVLPNLYVCLHVRLYVRPKKYIIKVRS